MGQFAKYLGGELPHLNILRFNRVKGQPFKVARLVEEIGKIMDNNA